VASSEAQHRNLTADEGGLCYAAAHEPSPLG